MLWFDEKSRSKENSFWDWALSDQKFWGRKLWCDDDLSCQNRIMNIVTTLHFRTISIVTIAFLVLHSAKYTLGQLDSNVNTLRYDGEVNIGKICIICYLSFYFFKSSNFTKRVCNLCILHFLSNKLVIMWPFGLPN